MDCEYENAVYGAEERAEWVKKKAKTQIQLPHVEPVPYDHWRYVERILPGPGRQARAPLKVYLWIHP